MVVVMIQSEKGLGVLHSVIIWQSLIMVKSFTPSLNLSIETLQN